MDNNTLEFDSKGIATGNTKEDNKMRKKFIFDFYAKWNAEHPDKQIYNSDLKEFINVKYLSINETAGQAARSYKSTLAVTFLTEILELAIKKTELNPKKETKNQKQFQKIILMEYEKESFGKIKLTVGVLKSNKDKIQYCITAI